MFSMRLARASVMLLQVTQAKWGKGDGFERLQIFEKRHRQIFEKAAFLESPICQFSSGIPHFL